MNGSTVPEANVEWTEVRDGSIRRWAVEERTSIYVAHLVAVKTGGEWTSPSAPLAAVVFWSSTDAGEAQAWLFSEANKDRRKWQPCLCCGKSAHATKAAWPGYCGKACRDADRD